MSAKALSVPSALVLLGLLLSTVPAGAADVLRILCAAHEVDVLREVAAGFVLQSGAPVDLTVTHNGRLASDFSDAGPFDAIIASCDRSGKRWEEQGLVDAATAKTLYYKRMAVAVAPANPAGILRYQDLVDRPVRIGLETLCPGRMDQTAKPLEGKVVLQSRDIGTLVHALQQGVVDAIVGFDADLRDYAGRLPIMRLPAGVYGPEGATPVLVHLTSNCPHREDTARLVEFMASSREASHAYLTHSLLRTNGMEQAESYDSGAAVRMMDAYQSVCRQVCEDYGILKGKALDIGCGPGRMTVELAKMTKLDITGLDIESQAIEVANGHAAENGFSDRLRFVSGDAHALPFASNSFDLVISRGTWMFLRDQPRAFQEVYRVLKPGGVAFIGGGGGRYAPDFRGPVSADDEKGPAEGELQVAPARPASDKGAAADPAQRREGGPRRGSRGRRMSFPFPIESYEALMLRAGIPASQYKAIREFGSWVEIRKEAVQ